MQLITGVRIVEMSQLQNCSREGGRGGGVRSVGVGVRQGVCVQGIN